MLSFGGSGDKLIVVATNEDPTNPNPLHIYYFTGAGGSTHPSSAKAFYLGSSGLFTVNQLADDPQNNNIAYIYVTDSNINGGTFQVFKVDFSYNTPMYSSTTLTMGYGSSFSVNTIVNRSTTNANDFYFAGKTKSLTDGAKTKTFLSSVGFVMKAITINQDETCLSFPSGYALQLPSAVTLSSYNLNWIFNDAYFTYPQSSLPFLPASSYNNLDSRSTNSTANQIWCTKSPYLKMNSAGITPQIIY